MSSRLGVRLLLPLLFLLALIPRITNGGFLTIDEAYHWFDRVGVFVTAIQHHDYAATNLIGHPGVTTLWLGGLGTWLERALIHANLIADIPNLHRALVRLPIAIVSSLCVIIAVPLMRRLFGQPVALLAALLWAVEPFLVAHSQLLHLDALLTSFMAVSLLALTAAVVDPNTGAPMPATWHLLFLSAISAGLAMLTKSPSVLLAPMAALILCVSAWRASQRTWRTLARATLPRLAVGGGLAALVWVALWPAAWLDLGGAVRRVIFQVQADGGSPHGWGNYFWGQAVSDPGLLFYLAAVPLRLAPWTLIGLIAAGGVALVRWQHSYRQARPQQVDPQLSGVRLAEHGLSGRMLLSRKILRLYDGRHLRDSVPQVGHARFVDGARSRGMLLSRKILRLYEGSRLSGGVPQLGGVRLVAPQFLVLGSWFLVPRFRSSAFPQFSGSGFSSSPVQQFRVQRFPALGILVLFALLFTIMMSIPPKKFDRYILPIFPVLDLIAAWGLIQGAALISTYLRVGWRVRANWFAAGFLALIGALNLAALHPYELAYFNPLVGGARVGAWVLPVGWGEGYEQVAAYVAAQPNGADRPLAALYEPALNPFAPAGAAPMDWAYEPGKVDYAVLYVDQIQRGYKPWLVSGLLGKVEPIHTVRIQGIDYAYVFQIPPPVGHPLLASFGPAIQLRGYDLDTTQLRASHALTITLAWQGAARPEHDYSLFVHVIDARGQKVAQVDVPPGGPRWPTSQWDRGRYISTIQRIPLAADLPAGSYHIAIGLYNPDGFQRLPLAAPPGTPDPGAGPDALYLADFTLP